MIGNVQIDGSRSAHSFNFERNRRGEITGFEYDYNFRPFTKNPKGDKPHGVIKKLIFNFFIFTIFFLSFRLLKVFGSQTNTEENLSALTQAITSS